MFLPPSGVFIKYFRVKPMLARFSDERIATLEFESANPSIVKSIRQRDFLNTWLRLYARDQSLPRMDEYRPERFGEELPDLVFLAVDTTHEPPRLTIEIKNLMRGGDKLPLPKLSTIIDRDLFHRAPGRIPVGDVLEFG